MSGLLKSLVVAARSGTAEPKSAGAETVDLSGVALIGDQLRAVARRAIQLATADPTNMKVNVDAAKMVLNAVAQARIKRRDTLPSPRTLANYERKRRQVEESMEDVPGNSFDKLQQVLGSVGRNVQTFRVLRAALKQGSTADLQATIEAVALTTSDLLGVRSALREDLRRGLAWLACILSVKHEKCLAVAGTTKLAPRSKSAMLKLLPQDWRERISLEASRSELYGLPCALLDICGLRPVELEKGVEVEVSGDRVRLRILGGKVREHAGQPWRELELRLDALPAWVRARLPSAGSRLVSADPDNMRAWLADVSERLFPRHQPPRRSDVLISAYVYRHALVTDMRDDGWTAEEIAAVIGESSAATVAWYGLKNVGGRAGMPKRPRAIAVDRAFVLTAREVKPRADQDSPGAVRKRGSQPR